MCFFIWIIHWNNIMIAQTKCNFRIYLIFCKNCMHATLFLLNFNFFIFIFFNFINVIIFFYSNLASVFSILSVSILTLSPVIISSFYEVTFFYYSISIKWALYIFLFLIHWACILAGHRYIIINPTKAPVTPIIIDIGKANMALIIATANTAKVYISSTIKIFLNGTSSFLLKISNVIYFLPELWKTGIEVSILKINVNSTIIGYQAATGKKSIIFCLFSNNTSLVLPIIPIEPQTPTNI